jgi:hypothetical protein
VPDSNCLENSIVVCDEEENCVSEVDIALPHEVNFLEVDTFLPVPGFDAPASQLNGWFVIHNDTVAPPGFTKVTPDLFVLGYSDNKANGVGFRTGVGIGRNPVNLNWEAIFPAPLTCGSPFEGPEHNIVCTTPTD